MTLIKLKLIAEALLGCLCLVVFLFIIAVIFKGISKKYNDKEIDITQQED